MPDSLKLGSIELNDGTTTIIDNGSDFGMPVPLTSMVERLFTDGEVVTGVRSGNRTIQIPVEIRGATRAAAALVEAQIAAQVTQAYSALTYTPQGGQPTVFDCFRGEVRRDWNSIVSSQGMIGLTLTLPALPFARAQSATTLVPTATTPVTLDSFTNGTSRTTSTSGLTGVSVTYDTTVKVEGTASLKLDATTSPSAASSFTSDYSFASTDLSAQSVVSLAWLLAAPPSDSAVWSKVSGGFNPSSVWTLVLRSAAGTATYTASQIPNGYGGTWQTVAWNLAAPASTTGTFNQAAVTSAAVTWAWGAEGPGVHYYLYVDYLRAAPANGLNITGASGTARLDGVTGTARTPVNLYVTANSGTFNRLLVCRYPNSASALDPILATSSGTATSTADATAINGSYYGLTVANNVRYTRLASTLNGTYVLVARLKGTGSTVTLTSTAYMSTDSTVNQVTTSRAFTTTDLPTSAYQLVTIGQLTLPPRDIPSNSTAIVNIDITATADVRVDQVYLVDMAGESVLIDPGTTRNYSRWQLRSPDPSGTRGTALAGTSTDGSDFLSVSPWLTGNPIINFDPGSNLVLLVADKASAGIGVQVEYYPRYQSEVTT